MNTCKSWLLVVAALALASPALEATKVQVMMTPPPAGEEADDAPLTRSIKTPGTTQVQLPPAAPEALTLKKIVLSSGAMGSAVYMAPAVAGGNPFNHSIIQLLPTYNAQTGAFDVAINPLIKEFAASFNGGKSPEVAGGPVRTYANPLYGNVVPHLVTMGDHVVATMNNGAALASDRYKVFVLKNGNPDLLVSTADRAAHPAGVFNPVDLTPLHDAGGADVDNAIVALAASKDKIFAAVPTAGGDFVIDSADRGVAVLNLAGDTLVQPNNAEGLNFNTVYSGAPNPENAAIAFSQGAGPVANVMTGATLDNPLPRPHANHASGVVMHYSPELDRLFVGFKNVHKNVTDTHGGVMGIVVGRPYAVGADPALPFRSLLYAPSDAALHTAGGGANLNTQNLANKIFTFYHGGTTAVGGGNLGNVPGGLVFGQLGRNQNPSVTIEHLKTMRTSTGRDYLIVASSIKVPPGGGAGAGAGVELAGVYFIPIMGQKNSATPALPALPATVGRVASPDFASVLSGGGGAPAGANPAILAAAASLVVLPTHQNNAIWQGRQVGPGRWHVGHAATAPRKNFISNINEIKDLQVVGDTVLITFARPDAARQNNLFGVYQSTAIFNNDGNITGWTPLERMSGAAQKAHAAAVDPVSGNLMYLTTLPPAMGGGSIFNISDWRSNGAPAQELQKLIAQHFPKDKGGVRAIQTFDDDTPSFDVRRNVVADGAASSKKTAVTVVLGSEKVMVVQTLHSNRPALHFYDQASAAAKNAEIAALPPAARPAATALATTFADAAPVAPAAVVQNVFTFENDDLKRIAPLTCAEVLRINVAAGATTLGHLYVGGYRGVCRLEAAAGAGWATGTAAPDVTGLNDFAAYAVALATFVRCNNPALKEVIKIVSTPCRDANARARLAVVMNDRVAHVDATAGGLPGTLNLSAILAGNNIDLAADAPIFDAVMLRDRTAGAANDDADLILATANGLVVRELHGANVHRVPMVTPGDVPLQLAYVPRERGGVVGGGARAAGGAGMLYVLVGNQAKGEVKLQRFEVRWDAAPANVLTRIAGDQPITFETFRRYFATDGYRFFMGHDAALDTSEMLALRTMSNPKTASFPLSWTLGNVGLGDFACPGVRDAVTGAWMVAGSFGLKVNE